MTTLIDPVTLEVSSSAQFSRSEVNELAARLSHLLGRAASAENQGTAWLTKEEFGTLERCWEMLREVLG